MASFDRRAGSYERDWRWEFHAPAVAAAAEVALAALPDPRAVLDVGCGTGALLRTLAELEAMLARAGLAPLAWERVYDLGPLPLVRAVVAARN